MNFDWLIQELQVQSAVCEMTGDGKKVNDIKNAIDILRRKNGYKLPRMMHFLPINQPPKQQFKTITIQNTSSAPLTAALFAPGNNPSYPSPSQNVPGLSNSGCSPVPTPTPASCTINPANLINNYNYSTPSVGHEIAAIFTASDGSTKFCIYTWQEDDNPEELKAYVAGWDPGQQMDGCETWMPCKKFKHEKLLVICQHACCPQNI